MHEKYGKDGLVAISVSLDNPRDKNIRAATEAFLVKQRATFTNVMLDAKIEEWTAKLKISGPPCIYVFDRKNRIAGKWLPDDDGENKVDYDAVEKAVVGLLKK
jgi:hypothetical protein